MSIGVVELGLAGLTEVVQVTATEQRVVETITSDRSALITEEQIETITVRGRDVTSMLRVLPGVSYEKDAEATGEIVIGSWLPEVTGARAGWSTVTIDGIPSNDIGLPSVSTHSMSADAVGEINVRLNNFTADSGRNGGANINIVTKSGSNDFAGGAYAYGRRERFRGQNYFDELNGIDKPLYRYSTLGGNLGGRIVQDKAFFFYNFEKWSVEAPVSASQATVPTAFERMGDFSQSFDSGGNLIVVTDPLTGMPFPGNRIPADRINPNGQALLNTFPAANATDLGLTGGTSTTSSRVRPVGVLRDGALRRRGGPGPVPPGHLERRAHGPQPGDRRDRAGAVDRRARSGHRRPPQRHGAGHRIELSGQLPGSGGAADGAAAGGRL